MISLKCPNPYSFVRPQIEAMRSSKIDMIYRIRIHNVLSVFHSVREGVTPFTHTHAHKWKRLRMKASTMHWMPPAARLSVPPTYLQLPVNSSYCVVVSLFLALTMFIHYLFHFSSHPHFLISNTFHYLSSFLHLSRSTLILYHIFISILLLS